MKYIYFYLLTLVISSIVLYSKPKTDTNLFGHVVNMSTKEHNPYIPVFIKGTTIGTYTDKTVHYFLKNLPEGKFIVSVRGLGSKTIEKEVKLSSDKSVFCGNVGIIKIDTNLKIEYPQRKSASVSLYLYYNIGEIQSSYFIKDFPGNFNSFQSDFDKGEYRDSGYIYGPSLPRTYFIGAKLLI